MIQINNVPSPFGIFNATPQTSSTTNSSTSTESFQSALSAAVNQTLEQFGMSPNSVNISITPSSASAATPTPNAVATNPTNATSVSASSSAAASNSVTTNSVATNSATSNSATTSAAPATTSPDDQTQNSTESFDQAYWASQPAAVQALQNITDPNQRMEMATQLAEQGYTIDVPIMAWGWDPALVTASRESDGYTWVPSALQNPLQSAPGINDTGLQPYDPNNPPAGSIAV